MPKTNRTNNVKQAGVALVLVLWVTVLLTIMAGAFTLSLQREAKLVAALKAQSQANALAEGGLNHALLMLALNDPENAWHAGGAYTLEFGGALVRLQIEDERGKLDLNFVDRDLLVKLLSGLQLETGMPDKLADAILDWRDEDNDIQLNGAELKDYRAANLPYAPRNAPFQSVEELQLVLGMDAATFRQLRPLFTVYTRNGKVDPRLAVPALLRLLQAVGDVAPAGQGLPGQTPADSTAGAPVGRSAAGGIYAILAEAILPEGQVGRVQAIVRHAPAGAVPFETLSWAYPIGGGQLLSAANPFQATIAQ